MPTNRSFFANFLAAFRAHSAIQQANSTTANASSAHTASSTSASASTAFSASNARAISTKAGSGAGATSAAVQAAGHLQSARQQSTSPLPRSPRSARSPRSSAGPPGSPIGGGSSRRRRSSSSSTEGFRDALGAEKWYIGGRNAAGEETFYRLGMARRHRSFDRLSVDRVSL